MQTHRRCVIAGLGNPGKEYEGTRHNIGRAVVSRLAEKLGLRFKRAAPFEALHARCERNGVEQNSVEVDLLLPETYMNDSGRSISRFMRFFKLGLESLVVVVDDIAIPFGTMRVRMNGSHGGHNGLKSVESYLGTRDYQRLRLGIGESQHDDLVDHVLGRFSEEELQAIPLFVEGGAMCLVKLIGLQNI